MIQELVRTYTSLNPADLFAIALEVFDIHQGATQSIPSFEAKLRSKLKRLDNGGMGIPPVWQALLMTRWLDARYDGLKEDLAKGIKSFDGANLQQITQWATLYEKISASLGSSAPSVSRVSTAPPPQLQSIYPKFGAPAVVAIGIPPNAGLINPWAFRSRLTLPSSNNAILGVRRLPTMTPITLIVGVQGPRWRRSWA